MKNDNAILFGNIRPCALDICICFCVLTRVTCGILIPFLPLHTLCFSCLTNYPPDLFLLFSVLCFGFILFCILFVQFVFVILFRKPLSVFCPCIWVWILFPRRHPLLTGLNNIYKYPSPTHFSLKFKTIKNYP